MPFDIPAVRFVVSMLSGLAAESAVTPLVMPTLVMFAEGRADRLNA